MEFLKNLAGRDIKQPFSRLSLEMLIGIGVARGVCQLVLLSSPLWIFHATSRFLQSLRFLMESLQLLCSRVPQSTERLMVANYLRNMSGARVSGHLAVPSAAIAVGAILLTSHPFWF